MGFEGDCVARVDAISEGMEGEILHRPLRILWDDRSSVGCASGKIQELVETRLGDNDSDEGW